MVLVLAVPASSQLNRTQAIPAGEYLRKELEAREISQRELAERMEPPVQTVNEIVNGNKGEGCVLDDLLGAGSRRRRPFWLTVDTIAQLAHARASERKSLQDRRVAGAVPSFNHDSPRLDRSKTRPDQARAVLQLFGVASFTALTGRQEALGLRISKHAPIDEFALLCRVRKGALDGRAIETAEYDEAALRDGDTGGAAAYQAVIDRRPAHLASKVHTGRRCARLDL